MVLQAQNTTIPKSYFLKHEHENNAIAKIGNYDAVALIFVFALH